MTSPLLDYANGWLLTASRGVPSVVSGRVVASAGTYYLVHAYLKRQDSAGTSTGADYLPLQSGGGIELDGGSGQIYLYRGYALRYAVVSSSYDLNVLSLTGLTFVDFNFTATPQWMSAGTTGSHRQGNEKPCFYSMQSSTGKFGNDAIDELINVNIGGIPIVIRSGQVLN